MVSSDLKGMYLHLSINDDFQEDFGFAVINEKGEEEWYIFLYMPFGYSPASAIMTKLVKPLVYFLHDQGIDASWYLDDSASFNQSFFQCKLIHEFIKFCLSCAGWQVNIEKSSSKPEQSMVYLGFIIDSRSMIISAPMAKIVRVGKLIDELLKLYESQTLVFNKQIAALLGNTCHLIQSHGDVLRISSRFSQQSLGQSVEREGWDGKLLISSDMAREMKLCKEYLFR